MANSGNIAILFRVVHGVWLPELTRTPTRPTVHIGSVWGYFLSSRSSSGQKVRFFQEKLKNRFSN